MPRRADWPVSATDEREELITLLEQIHRGCLTSVDMKVNLSNRIKPKFDRVKELIYHLNTIKLVDYSLEDRGDRGENWPRWVVWGITNAIKVLIEIEILLSEIGGQPEIYRGRAIETNFKICANLTERLLNWLKYKQDIKL